MTEATRPATADPNGDLEHLVFVTTSAWTLSEADRFSFQTVEPAGRPEMSDLPALGAALLAGDGIWLHDAAPDQRDAALDRPVEWTDGPAAAALMAQVVQRVRGVWTQSRANALPPGGAELARRLKTIRHRLFYTADAARRVFGVAPAHPTAGLDACVVIDLRFRYLLARLQCHVSTSIWTRPPLHPFHGPRPPRVAAPDHAGPAPTTAQIREHFQHLAAGVEALLARHLVRAELSVHLRRYTLPEFWVAASLPRRDDPADYLTGADAAITRRLASTFLDVRDPRGSVASRSVIDGCVLALRRVRRTDGSGGEADVPTYLMLPSAGTERGRDAGTELATANAITALTDLEAEAAARLFEVEAELDINHTHMAMYNAAAERAGFLLDALSTHLPIRRGRRLADAHRQVDLLHQTLLQAVADLAHVTALIRARASEIGDAAEALRDDFDDKVTEFVPWRRVKGLRTALTETGLFEAARRSATDRLAEADRVRATYDDLLRAIASAFDERRVREFDQIQKASALLAVALGVLSIVTIFNGNNSDEAGFPKVTAHMQANVAQGANVTAVVLVVGAAIWFVSGLARVGRLGSAGFRRQYDGRGPRRRVKLWRRTPTDPSRPSGWRGHSRVWQFMLETSTDNLDRLVARAREDSRPVEWDRLDLEFAHSFAHVWDSAGARRGSPDRPAPARRQRRIRRDFRPRIDIDRIGYQIEQWSVQSLLFTERARRMYRYRLPVLTSLYRCCGHIADSFLFLSYVSPDNMVADVDYYRCLEPLGFTRPEIREIDEWLRLGAATGDGRSRFESAHAALTHVRQLGLKSTMDESDRARTLAVARGTRALPAPRRPVQGVTADTAQSSA